MSSSPRNRLDEIERAMTARVGPARSYALTADEARARGFEPSPDAHTVYVHERGGKPWRVIELCYVDELTPAQPAERQTL